jgi:gas vesicle protein
MSIVETAVDTASICVDIFTYRYRARMAQEGENIMNNENTPKGLPLAAFLIGALAGGVTALLFAPQTGAQVRGRLKRGAHDLREKGESLAHEVEGAVKERAETVTEAMKTAVSDAKSAYKDERRAAGSDTKRYGETETSGNRARTGTQS